MITPVARTVLMLLFLLPIVIKAETYRFTGAEDQNFFNPANWSPACPGVIIFESDQIILEADVLLDVPLLIIQGGIRLESGVSMEARDTHMQITEDGWLDNRGILRVSSLTSEGNTIFQPWSSFQANEVWLEPDTDHIWMAASEILIDKSLELHGRLMLSGRMLVGGDFLQEGSLTMQSSADLHVGQDMLMRSNTEIRLHPFSEMVVGKS